MPLGKKICPNCNTEIGARTKLCDCGWYFPEGELRKHLLKAKKVPEKNKVYTSEGRGRKKCPGCQLIIGGVTRTCFSCSFDFVSAKKEKDTAVEEIRTKKQEEKEKTETVEGEKTSPQVVRLMQEAEPYEAPKKLTPKEQAERILSYGKKRAALLFKLAKTNHYWSHVDWNKVEEDIGALPDEDTSLIIRDDFDEYGDESDEIFCF